MQSENRKVILLIDGDNANKFDKSIFEGIFSAAKNYGYVAESHVFVNAQSIKGDKNKDFILEMVTKYAIHLHVLPIKKNSTDISLAIRATEKLYTDQSFETYIIVVAGDHDYMPLAVEIRQHGKKAVCFYVTDRDGTLLSAFDASEKVCACEHPATIDKKFAEDVARVIENSLKTNKKIDKISFQTLGTNLKNEKIDYAKYYSAAVDGLYKLLTKLYSDFPDVFKKFEIVKQNTTKYFAYKK